MSYDHKEIHNSNCVSLSVLATRRHKFSTGKKNKYTSNINSVRLENISGLMKTDYQPNVFTITKQ